MVRSRISTYSSCGFTYYTSLIHKDYYLLLLRYSGLGGPLKSPKLNDRLKKFSDPNKQRPASNSRCRGAPAIG